MLQRMAQELSQTWQVIERATLAYHVSLWTLEKIERNKFNSYLNDRNSPPLPASPPERSGSES
jgi:hypothetical protein